MFFKVKSLSLLSGMEGEWRWLIRLDVYSNGTFKNYGHIGFQKKRTQEENRKINKKYWLENKEKLTIKNKEYRDNHKEKIAIHRKDYWKTTGKFKQQEWKLTNKGRKSVTISYRKHSAKHRTLNFIPINEHFRTSEAHHIDKNFVIFIPKELHRSIPHNIWNGNNMKIINDLVFEWLKDNFKLPIKKK